MAGETAVYVGSAAVEIVIVTMGTTQPMKAYKTSAIGTECIVFAESRGAARHATVLSANDAGYKITYKDVDFARRAPELDSVAIEKGLKPGKCYAPSFIKPGFHV